VDQGSEAERISFIDVPGHRKFVQTMIAGAAGIDLGLLVIAADDGPMPQTREHLAILAWLGVPALVVALSKVDAVDEERRESALREVRALVDGSPYATATIVPVSIVSGEGIVMLKHALRAHRDRVQAQPAVIDAGPNFRLAIDRAFVLQGIGLTVTGTCFSGRVAVDDVMTLLPGRLEARVRGIHAQNRPTGEAHGGQRVALNLVGRGVEKSSVHRGDWVVAPSIAIDTDRLDVILFARGAPADGEAMQAIDQRTWRNLRFHAGAASVNARVVLLGSASPLAQIVFEKPLHLLAGDRFILRDGSTEAHASGSIAGGIVLDVDVPARGRRSEARLAFLQTAARGNAQATLAHAVNASEKGVALARWNVAHNTAFAAGDIENRIGARAVRGATSNIGEASQVTLFSHARWDTLLARVIDVLASEHARSPDAVGPGRDRLRRMATPSLDATNFAALIATLKAAARISQTGAWLHLPEHRVELSAEDRARFDRARVFLDGAHDANHPPRVRDIARELHEDEAVIRSLFVRLASLGEIYRVAHDHYYTPAAVHVLARVVAELQQSEGLARAAAFRDRIGVGRKIAIQILEFFDRVGYTRRVGDEHRVIQPGLFDA
ncbi:MAG: selenocysteine-specific translation elongation factor, partial [Burkholderiaceae bacterium]